MALAPYGEGDVGIRKRLEGLCAVTEDGFDARDFTLRCLGSGLSLDRMRARAEVAAALEHRPRLAGEPLDPFHHDVAHAVQGILEDAVLAFVRTAVAQTGERNLCVAGGVFLNCKLNQRLRESGLVSGLYAQPVAKDSGVALGSAWYRSCPPGARLDGLASGGDITGASAAHDLARWRVPFERVTDPAAAVAGLLTAGRVVLFLDGRAEFGPRALGSRSILADPRRAAMAERVNLEVKAREAWRPFGPSILAEHAGEILEGAIGGSAPFMIESFPVRPEWRSRLAAVVHPADGTTRPHLVRREVQPRYHAVISEFHRRTGVPAVLNTSLNDRGQPIADSLRDARRVLLHLWRRRARL